MTKRVLWVPLQGITLGLAFCSLWLMVTDRVMGAELDLQGWQLAGKMGVVAVAGIVFALVVRLIGYQQEKRTAEEMNERIWGIAAGIEILQNSRESRIAEWMHWMKRWMLIVYELGAFLIFYITFVGLSQRSDWKSEIMRLEMTHQNIIEEVYDVVWPSMMAGMTNKWFFILFPLILVGATFGKRLKEKQVPLMYRQHISLKRWYINSYLANALLGSGLFVIFLIAQMVGNNNWTLLMEWSDYPFMLRMLGYSLVLMCYLTAVVQLVYALLDGTSRGRWILAVVLSVAFIWLLVQPGAKLTGWILTGGDPLLMEDFTARNYLLYDIQMGVLGADYTAIYAPNHVPVLESPDLVRTWGQWMHVNMLLVSLISIVVGYLAVQHRYLKRKVNHPILQKFHLTLESGHIYALVDWEEDAVDSLLKMMSGEVRSNGSQIVLPGGTSNVGYYLGESLYDGLFDARTNLRRIQLWQGKQKGYGRLNIEEVMELAGMDRLGRSDNWILEVKDYVAGERVMYGVAAALLTNPQVLVLMDVLDDLEASELERIQRTLLRLKERGITILLSCRQRENLGDVSDQLVEYPLTKR